MEIKNQQTTDMDVQTGNRLIAEFMGAFIANQYTGLQIAADTMQIIGNTFPDFMHTCRVDKLKYHTSWDWLMPVVEKIYSLQKGKWYDKTRGFATDIWLSFQDKINIESTWQEVIKFITWYNKVINDGNKNKSTK